MTSLYGIFEMGGWVMYIIALAAWIGLAVFLLKLWRTRRAVVVPHEEMERILRLSREGELRAAFAVAKDDSVAGRLAKTALSDATPARDIEALLEETGRREVTALAQYNGVLSTVASVSPLLGLLGTVLGLITMFQSIGSDGSSMAQVSADVMASGIWTAMLTTAWGLIVAIPALLGSKWLHARVEHRAAQLEDFTSQLARLCVRQREGEA